MMPRRPLLRSTPTAASVPVEREPASPRFPSLLGAGWRRAVRLVRRVEDCWIGDFLGVVSLFAILWMLSFLSLLVAE